MPYQTTIGRLTSVEFLAAMPPGLFVFLVSYVCLSNVAIPRPTSSLWECLLQLSGSLKTTPPMILFMLFGAYLLGSIIRSIPVQRADNVFRGGRSKFPYVDALSKVLTKIEQESGSIGLNLVRLEKDETLASITFNYWKDWLCVRSTDAFAFYQTFEARSRFFAGMFWSGAAGLIVGTAMLIRSCFAIGLFLLAAQLLILSVGLIVAFGFQLRRVREQEACVLLTLYVAVAQQRDSHR